MSCQNRSHTHQSCPDLVPYLQDQIRCQGQYIALLQQQVSDLVKRDNFIWCKLKEIADADLIDRVVELESDTDFLDNCGVLTLDCELSESGSASFSASA